MSKADIGLVGLAVMGENLVLNMESKGFTVAAFNRTTSKVDAFVNGRAKGKNILGAHSIEEFASLLKRPRKVMIMVKAGKAVDDFIEQILPHLEPGDVLIDGGNTHYPDTIRRTAYVESKGMLYIGTGVSGGEEGALKGPSIMPGGSSGRVAPGQAHLPGDRGEDGGRHALLRLGGRERGRPLREDGPQRDRVRRHAAHLRGLRHPEERARDVGLRDARRLRGVEQGRARQLPRRDHPGHPGLQGRGRAAAGGPDPRHRRPEGHRQVDGHRGPRARHSRSPSSARRSSLAASRRSRRSGSSPRRSSRARRRSSRGTGRPSSRTSARPSTPRRWSRTPRATR